MNVLTYEIKLLEPALVTALDGDPNSSITLGYLPGSILRGAIIQKYIQQQKKNNHDYQFDPAHGDVRTLFFDGQTRFLNGYLLNDKQRGLPVPLSWQHKKGGNENKIYDFAYEDASLSDPETDWQGIKDQFCTFSANKVQLLVPKRLTTVHITRDRHISHKLQEKSEQRAVYRYVALAAGQTFSAAIICSTEKDASILKLLLQGQTWIGGSRTAGYGRVEFINITTKPGGNWRELETELEEGAHQVFVTFVSDALIRDPQNGQYVVNPQTVATLIQAQLGKSELREAFLQAVYIGGFNRKWGLPLPQVIAVKMGSVFVFDTPEGVNQDKLRQLEQNGLGERRSEGFGRVLINWHNHQTIDQSDDKRSDNPARKIADDISVSLIARNMANRLLQDQLDLLVAQEAEKLSNQVKGIRKSQLNRLRMVIQNELFISTPQKQKRFQNYLAELKKRSVTRKQFDRVHLAGKPLIDWLEMCFTSEKLMVDSPSTIPKISDVKAELTSEIVYEYNLRLAEAVLAQAAKKAGDE